MCGLKFCVYEHWRPDTGVCFYVGKGLRSRPYRISRPRNPHHQRIVEKLKKKSLSVEVRIVIDRVTEAKALSIEIERIAFWRDAGIKLTNLTDGGEGVSGWRPSDQIKAKTVQSCWGTPAVRKKMIAGLRTAWSDPVSRKKRIEKTKLVMARPSVRRKIRDRTRAAMASAAVKKNQRAGLKRYWG